MRYAKKILLLGGAYSQIPVIQEARRHGWYVITCDYLPDNPGHKYADEYYNVSTTDVEGVLRLAEKIKPDFVITYASDPAAPTAAYVSEKLGLPGNPYRSIQLLSDKYLFRELLRENGFNTPQVLVNEWREPSKINGISIDYPVVVKPVDSSGSKGVSVVNTFGELNHAVGHALSFSLSERVIIEEYIDAENGDLHGDGFFLNGELVFCLLGDHHYNNEVNPVNPAGTSWPSVEQASFLGEIKRQVESIARNAGYMNGPVNIEARITGEGNIYIMEIGPRSGGHFVPQAIYHATGFDMVKAQLDILIQLPVEVPTFNVIPTSYYALHSKNAGYYGGCEIIENIEPYIVEQHFYVERGARVRSFDSSSAALGILILAFPDIDLQQDVMSQAHNNYNIIIDRSEAVVS